MRRLKSILTPPATAGRGTRLIAAAVGLGILSLVGVATAAVASQRAAEAPWVDQEPTQAADDAEATAQAAARQAVAAARRTMTSEQRERFRDPSVADYRRICASDEPGDDGFCSGVIFSQLRETGVCAPPAIDDPDRNVSGPALGVLVERTKAQFDAIPASSVRSPMELAQAALQRAYPCQSAAVGDRDATLDAAVARALATKTEDRRRLVHCETGPAGEFSNCRLGAAPNSADRAQVLCRVDLNDTLSECSVVEKTTTSPAAVTRAGAVASTATKDAAPLAGTVRLTVRLDGGQEPLQLRNGDKATVVVEGGRWGRTYRQEISTGRTWGFGAIQPVVLMDLDLSTMTRDGRYRVRAEVQDRDGNRLYASSRSVPLTVEDRPLSVNVPLRVTGQRAR